MCALANVGLQHDTQIFGSYRKSSFSSLSLLQAGIKLGVIWEKSRDSGYKEEYLDLKWEEVPRKWNDIKHTFTIDTCCLNCWNFD